MITELDSSESKSLSVTLYNYSLKDEHKCTKKNKQNQIKKCVAVIQDFQRLLFIFAHPPTLSFPHLPLYLFLYFSLPYNTFDKTI